jgi:hypothetical protein
MYCGDASRVRLSTGPGIAVPLVATAFVASNIDRTRPILHEYGYLPKTISKESTSTASHMPSSQSSDRC